MVAINANLIQLNSTTELLIKILCNTPHIIRYIEIFRSTAAELRRSMFQNSSGNNDRPSPYDRNNRGDRGSRGMNNFGGNGFGNNGRNNMRSIGGDRRGGRGN